MRWWAGCCALILCCASIVQGQTRRCETFQGSPSLCSKIYSASDQIYIGPEVPGSSQAELAQQADPLASQIAIILVVSPACYAALSRFVCVSYFQNCSTALVNGTTIPIGRAPCRSECLNTNLVCAAIFQQFQVAPTNCSAINDTTGLALFPDGWQEYNLTGDSSPLVNVTCNAASLAPPKTSNCSGPLIKLTSGPAAGSCALRCPSLPYSQEHWHIQRIIMHVTGWVGLAVWIVVIVPLVFIRQRQDFPSNLPTCILFAVVLLNVSYIMNSVAGKNRVICSNRFTPARQERFACGLQGVLVVFGGLSTTCWCLLLTLNAVLMLYLGPETVRRPVFRVCYHIYGWGFPSLVCIILLARKRIGARYGFVFCFIVDKAQPARDDDGRWWSMGLLFVPELVNLACILVLMLLLFTKFFRQLSHFSLLGLYQLMRHQVRMVAFVLTFCYMVTVVVLFGFLSYCNDKKYTESGIEWIRCWSEGQPNCGKTPKEIFPFGLNALNAANLGTAVVFAAVFFGTLPEVFFWWKNLFLLISRRERRFLDGLVDRETSASLATSLNSSQRQSAVPDARVSAPTETSASSDGIMI